MRMNLTGMIGETQIVHKCKIIEQLPKDLLKQVLEAVSVIIQLEEE